MQNLISKIKEKERQSATLEMNHSIRADLLNQVNLFSNQYIDDLPELKSYTSREADSSRIAIGPQTKSIEEIIQVFQDEVANTGIRAASGGHLGYIPGGGIYTAALGDFLADISNAYAAVSYASPGAAAIENEVVNWLKNLFSFPKTAAGSLASGGSISNLIALTAARDQFNIKNEKITRSVIYLTEQVHHCIQKSLKIIGLEDIILHYVSMDDRFRMNAGDLEKQIQSDRSAGLLPFLVVASAGTTDTGAVDPLDEIAHVAQSHQLWFHVDAAYGGFFILTSKKDILKGIEKADSLVVDPHKGLFLPYGLGAVLIKNAKAVLHSNLYTANYMQDALTDDLTRNPANVSPELTRHFRGMRLWLPLQLHGTAPFAACLEEKLLLCAYCRNQLTEAGFCVGPEPDLSVSYFWYPYKEDTDAFNKKLLQFMHEDGTVFFSSTIINGQFVIRIAILSFRTRLTTVDKALTMIKNCLGKTIQFFAAS